MSTINQSTLSSANTTLERLRSLHAEREACTLFASSLLSHPLGATRTSNNEDDQDNDVQSKIMNKVLLDPLHPTSLPGGVRDAWSSLSRSARTLNVLNGEIDDLMSDANKTLANSGGGNDGQVITGQMIENEISKEKHHSNEEYTLSNGQLSTSCRMMALNQVLKREGELVELLRKDVVSSGSLFEGVQKEIQYATATADLSAVGSNSHKALLDSFYKRLNQVKAYHSQNTNEGQKQQQDATTLLPTDTTYEVSLASFPMMPSESALGVGLSTKEKLPSTLSGQKRKHGHPLADGYDIASLIATETSAVRSGEVYTPEELFGKYLDLVSLYEGEVRNMRHAFASTSSGGADESNKAIIGSVSMLSYLEFLSILSKGLNTSISESAKLKDRRKYSRFLHSLEKYLTSFLKRTSPFLNVDSDVIAKAIVEFNKEWSEKGGVDGWECRMAEASMALDDVTNVNGESSNNSATVKQGIDLSKYATSSDLEKGVSGDELKSELARLGLKCGGTVSDRAARLFLTKDTPLDKLPAKVFAKKKGGSGANKKAKVETTSSSSTAESPIADRRVDIARLEAIVTSLLDQLRPTLEGTRRLIERRTTQTENERDQEIDEDINGTAMDEDQPKGHGGGGNGSDDEDDEDDAPIYNPKNVPLGWDGKPIPYWLFKLHGLNHFYPCEICGNESYRGRRNFEKHFTESRHAYGMRCLGIPNTKHFHGVTKIEDAQELWGRLRTTLEGNQFDVAQEEEYEDSHGNVVNRQQYEDLARQGLL